MTRISVDTNLLVYAIDKDDFSKHLRATEILRRLAQADHVITQQALGEFMAVVRRRPAARDLPIPMMFDRLLSFYKIIATPLSALLTAYARASRYKLQYWDSLIVTVCLANGVTHLLSEDMQDGQNVDGLTIVNPFNPDNLATVDDLLSKDIQ